VRTQRRGAAAAYIVILGDKSIADNFFCDHGIAGQSILLGAAEKGLGGCFIGNVQRDKLRAELKITETMGHPSGDRSGRAGRESGAGGHRFFRRHQVLQGCAVHTSRAQAETAGFDHQSRVENLHQTVIRRENSVYFIRRLTFDFNIVERPLMKLQPLVLRA